MQRSETDALVIEQITKQLDAALASQPWTRLQLAYLPDAATWPIIDFAVRQWASPIGLTVERADHIGTDCFGTPHRCVVDRYAFRSQEIVTVHVPKELHPARVTELIADILEVR